jgi:hypothetical protein
MTNPNQLRTHFLPSGWDLARRQRKFRELESRTTKDANGCWLMPGLGMSKGYGCVVVEGQPWMAHRYMWALFNGGEVRDGLFVLHRCDVRMCVCPEHLFLGTHQDNMRDAAAKGRWFGPRKPRRPVPPKPKRGLITHLGRQVTLRELAAETGIPLPRLQQRYYVSLLRGLDLVTPKKRPGRSAWQRYPTTAVCHS